MKNKTRILNALTEFTHAVNGGAGSGNWGHSGRHGLVGGSAAGGGRSSKSKKSRRSSKSKSSEPSVIEPTKIEAGELPDSTDKTGKYTEAEKRAVERYVSGDMMWINQYLRGRMPDDVVLQPDEEKFLEDLKSATSKPIGKDMTLYRSVDARAVFGDITPLEFSNLVNYVVYGDTQRLIARDAIRLLERAEDSEITEKGFMSTTTDKDTATGWGDFTGSDKPVVVELKVPKGTKGVDLGEAMPELDKLMGQSEVLLHPGVTYRITGFRVDDGLIFTADVEGQQNNRLEVAKEDFAKYLNGGKGSGYHNHPGRKGKVGGSAPRSASQPVYDDYTEMKVKYYDRRPDTTIRSSKKREADIRRIKSMADNYDYERELSQAPDEVIRHMADEELPRITHTKLLEVQFNRMLAYRSAGRTKEDFDLATEVLKDAIGSGGDLLYKAKQRGVDLSIEREMSKRLMGDNKILVFRQQDGKFRKNDPDNITSRWSDIPNTNDGSGDNYYSAEANKDNIFIHPLVLYSAAPDDNATKSYSGEREYILENSKIKKIKKGTRVV